MRSAAVAIAILFTLHASLHAQTVDSTLASAIRPGTVELGIDGSLMAIEGLTRVSLMLRGGTFFGLSEPMALTGEGELGYSYTNALGALDLQFGAGVTAPIGDGLLWPYITLSGGIRQEWLGSFGQIRYPVGGDLGARLLFSRGGALRVAYRYRLVFNDPVSRFSEHRIILGVSLFLENR